jgi:hypothetical protein
MLASCWQMSIRGDTTGGKGNSADVLDDVEHRHEDGLGVSVLGHVHDVRLEDLDDLFPVLGSRRGEEVADDKGAVSGMDHLGHELIAAVKE